MVRSRFNKKGQVTIFVIIGLVLLITVGIVLYVTSQTKSGEKVTERELESVPEEFKPIRGFVESCVKQVAEEGIREMALHGGYIDPLNTDYSFFELDYDPFSPTESDVIDVGLFNNPIKVPYWYYLSGSNDCTTCGVGSWAPTVEFMELQLSLYIEDNLNNCLDGFIELEKTGFEVVALTSPLVDTVINDNGQNFLLTYELQASKDGAQQIIKDYYTTSELPLKKLYDIAYNITIYESLTNHLDSFSKHLIAQHAGPDMNLLPPLFYKDNERFQMFWSKFIVKQKIQNLIYSYARVFQVLGTKNFDDSFIEKMPENIPIEQTIYFQGILPIFSPDSNYKEEVSVDFLYLNQPIYVNVFPSSGDIISPEHSSFDASKINFLLSVDYENHYNFFYDLSYPLIIEIKNYDKTNKNNEINFVFALEVNLRKNYVPNELLIGQGPIPWSDDLVDLKIVNTDLSLSSENSNIIYGEQASQNIFCKESQMNSGNISMMVSDRTTGEPLEDVEVSYGCGTYAECFIGLTELKYGAGYLSSKMPICTNGYVLFEKEGYETKRVELTTRQDTPTNLGNVALYKKITKNISIQKFQINYLYKLDNSFGIPTRCFIPGLNSLLMFSGDCFEAVKHKLKIKGVDITNESIILTENESVIVKFELINNGISPDHKVYTKITGNESQEVELIPGRYAIDITYLDAEGVSIPEDCDKACEKCAWYETCTVKHCKYYPPNQIELKPAPWGGLDFNESMPVYLSPSNLYNNNTEIELYIITYPEPNEIACLDSLEEMGKKTEYTLKYRSMLIPKFVTNSST